MYSWVSSSFGKSQCLLLLAISLRGQTLADGIAAVQAGRFDEAARVLAPLARKNPDCFECQFYLGLAATSIGRLDAASDALRKACELAPRHEEACYYLARDLYALGHYQAARAPFETALSAAPPAMLSKVHRAIALNYVALDLPEDAERHFLKAIQAAGRPTRGAEDPRVDYGAFLFRQGRTGAALRPLQQAVQDAPSSARANLELGRVLLHLEKTDAAASCLEKAVQLAPDDFNGHLLLGRAYLKLGKTAEGEKELRLGEEGWAAKREAR